MNLGMLIINNQQLVRATTMKFVGVFPTKDYDWTIQNENLIMNTLEPHMTSRGFVNIGTQFLRLGRRRVSGLVKTIL